MIAYWYTLTEEQQRTAVWLACAFAAVVGGIILGLVMGHGKWAADARRWQNSKDDVARLEGRDLIMCSNCDIPMLPTRRWGMDFKCAKCGSSAGFQVGGRCMGLFSDGKPGRMASVGPQLAAYDAVVRKHRKEEALKDLPPVTLDTWTSPPKVQPSVLAPPSIRQPAEPGMGGA